MASVAQLAIAKANLTAVLLRPDPAPCSRDDIDEFTRLLAQAATRCSPAHVQACKQWTIRHVSVSAARTAAAGRYLVALANSYPPTPANIDSSDAKATSTRRRRLHLLYIVNDVLYHVTYHSSSRDVSTPHHFTANIEPSLLPLVTSAASFSCAPKQIAKIRSLLDLWADKGYFAESLLSQLRAAIDKAVEGAGSPSAVSKYETEAIISQTATSSAGSKAPFLMPALHGDPATPWYDLPAANWLAVLEPNSTRPMNPNALKPLKMTPGPAPPALVASVQSLLADVNRMFGESDSSAIDEPSVDTDIDALGEHVEIDAFNGDIISGDSYYGWSRAFCKNMRERGLPKVDSIPGTRRSGDQDRGRRGHPSDDSRSPSISPRPDFKRRRYSDDGRQSRSRSRSRSRSADDRRQETSLRVPIRDYRRRHSRGRSNSRSRSRSRSKSRPFSQRYSKSRSQSRSRSRSPRRDGAQPREDPKHAQYQRQHHFGPGGGVPALPVMPGIPLPGAFAFVPPPPPPRPQGYQGPWPPSLPPPPLFLPPNPQQPWPQPPHMPVPPSQGHTTSTGGWAGDWSQINAPQQQQQQQQHQQQQHQQQQQQRQQSPHQHHYNNRGRGGRGGWNNNRW